MLPSASSAEALLSLYTPTTALLALRPQLVAARARSLRATFPGEILYAVKCNDHPLVLEAVRRGGIRGFDVASLGEIRAIRSLLGSAPCHFMNPVKPREAIAEAYGRHDVKSFVLDCGDEFDKILQATNRARDLDLHIRLAVDNTGSLLKLAGKFGCTRDEAAALVRSARRVAKRIGITFHVGSQCTDPTSYGRAIDRVGELLRETGPVEILDVGGGFPASYSGSEPSFAAFCDVIQAAVERNGLERMDLRAEPGRATVAAGASVLTRVELRKGQALHLNDGVYGNLAELKYLRDQTFPMRVVRRGRPVSAELVPFDFYGPTCDSADAIPGPHWLPADVATGEWLEIGQLGAYSNVFLTDFNGVNNDGVVLLEDTGPVASRLGLSAA